MKRTIAASLENKDVLEYPTFYLVTRAKWTEFPLATDAAGMCFVLLLLFFNLLNFIYIFGI